MARIAGRDAASQGYGIATQRTGSAGTGFGGPFPGAYSGRPGTANDIGMALAGVVVFVAAFLPWYGWKVSGVYVLDYDAWSGGVFSVLPVLLCPLAGVAAAVRVFAGIRLPALGPVGPGFLLVAAPAGAVVLVGIRWVTAPDGRKSAFQVSYEPGVRYGLLVALFAALVQLAFAALAFQASGEDLPGRARPPSPVAVVPYGQPYGPQPMPVLGPYGQGDPASPFGVPGVGHPGFGQQAPGQQGGYGPSPVSGVPPEAHSMRGPAGVPSDRERSERSDGSALAERWPGCWSGRPGPPGPVSGTAAEPAAEPAAETGGTGREREPESSGEAGWVDPPGLPPPG